MTRARLIARSVAILAISAGWFFLAGSALAEPGFVHERRVTVQFEGRSEPGLLLDSVTALSRAEDAELARRVCVGNHCAAILGPEPCGETNCPVRGTRLVLDRPLAQIPAWPRNRDDERRLCTELERDDALTLLVWSCVPRPLPITWGNTRYPPSDSTPFHWEISAAAAGIAPHREQRVALGGEISFGASWNIDYSRPSDWAFGKLWGASVRAGAYGGGGTRVAITVGLDSFNIVGYSDRNRVRVPSLIEAIVPEAGFLVRTGSSAEPLLRWRLPFDILLTRAVAIDVRPTFAIAYPTSGAPPEWMLGLSLGALLRLP